jgi:general stress protein YciG
MTEEKKRTRGFGAMDPAKQREIASQGGIASHRQGRAHEFTSEEAKAAGSKGGKRIAANRAHMAAIGRTGGAASGVSKRERAAAE